MAELDTHVWHVPVSDDVRALSPTVTKAMVAGSTFARRMETADPEHRARMCEHGRLLFQHCSLCEAGVPAMCDLTFAEMRENARRFGL